MHDFTPSSAAKRIGARSLRPTSRPGPDVISLSSGDPDFDTPNHIRNAMIDALQSGYTHYSDGQGDAELRAALADHVSKRSVRSYEPTEILVTHGASAAIASAFLASINPGDRVVIPEPTYSVYADVLNLIGAETRYVPTDSGFHLDFDQLVAACDGARMIVICNPGNPSGIVFRPDEIARLAELADRYNLLVFADEAYDCLVFDGVEFTSTLAIEALQHRLIYCASLSKTYAMTGWRVGYLAAPGPIIREAARIHRTFNNSMNSAVQRAALEAITVPSHWPEKMRQEYQYRRDLAADILSEEPAMDFVAPDGAFYAMVRNPPGLTSQQVVDLALADGVAVRAGSEYGPSGEGYFRITFATGREALVEGLKRLRKLNAESINQVAANGAAR